MYFSTGSATCMSIKKLTCIMGFCRTNATCWKPLPYKPPATCPWKTNTKAIKV